MFKLDGRWKIPTLDEYLDIALYSSATILALAQACVGMEEAGIETFKWLARGGGKTLNAINAIGRFYNDIVTNEVLFIFVVCNLNTVHIQIFTINIL